MPKAKVETSLRRFAVLANRSALNTRDWERFYAFISTATRYQAGWNHLDVQRRLRDFGFDNRLAQELGEIYWHSRCVLFIRRRQYNFGRDSYSDWLKKHGTPLT